MSQSSVVAILVVVAAALVGLHVLGAIDPALAVAVRRVLVAEAELASVLLTPIALVVAITRPGRS